MPTDREAELLDAMIDAPDDEGLRLVFADLLLERGDERGEIIQLHREIASASKARAPVRGRKLVRAYLDQVEACEGDVHGGLASDGWFWHLTMPAAKLLAHAELVFAIGPIHHLRLTGAKDHVAELAACRHLRWVYHLELGNNDITADGAVLLSTSPHLARLRGLDIHGNPIGERGAGALLDGRFDRLRSLNMSFANLGPEGIAHAATSPITPALEVLALVSDEAVGEGIAPVLANSRVLRELRLSFNDIGDAGAIAIGEATHLDKLTSISITGCGIGDAGVEALASAAHLTKVDWLDLDDNAFGPRGGRALASSATLQHGCRLGFAKNRRLTTSLRNALKKRYRKI